MTVRVTFEHDDDMRKWDVYVEGVMDGMEARQALNAVVLTCRDVQVSMEHVVSKTRSSGTEVIYRTERFNIIPHVRALPAESKYALCRECGRLKANCICKPKE